MYMQYRPPRKFSPASKAFLTMEPRRPGTFCAPTSAPLVPAVTQPCRHSQSHLCDLKLSTRRNFFKKVRWMIGNVSFFNPLYPKVKLFPHMVSNRQWYILHSLFHRPSEPCLFCNCTQEYLTLTVRLPSSNLHCKCPAASCGSGLPVHAAHG